MTAVAARASHPGAPLLVVSPHCDDGVLGCGDLLHHHPGAHVVTVFAEDPEHHGALTDWDRRAGLAAGDDVMALRRAEDRAALATLGATPCWLAFRDAQYAPSSDVATLARALDAVLAAADPLCVARLFHADHALVHRAALRVLRSDPARRTRTWLAYADALYRRMPGPVAQRLAGLAADGGPDVAVAATRSGSPGCADRCDTRCARPRASPPARCAIRRFAEAVVGLPWALRHRRRVPRELEAELAMLEVR